jgi:ATP-dependent DNA helicase RecQ
MMLTPAEVLKKYWGYDQFRSLQLEVIEAALAQEDLLALMPTGGGKSICFQVPALMKSGLCIVISPLIALMKDQVSQLGQRGITASAIHSGMSKREIDHLLDNAANSDLKFLYCSPERLKSDLFLERIKKVIAKRGVSYLVIDEAHCISQWGHDFRPAYLDIYAFREWLPEVPVLAFTATATEEVREDINRQLGLTGRLFQKSFARTNLSYAVRFEEHKDNKLVQILHKVEGSAIIYVNSRKRTKEVAYHLHQHGFSVDFYHAGLTFKDRSLKQEAWVHDRTRIIVTTNAFGMGIDKANVRLVVHLDLPYDIESYYQEAGRAGRDEHKAYALILCHQKDIDVLRSKIQKATPDIAMIQQTYQMLGNYYQLANGSYPQTSFDFDQSEFYARFKKHPVEIFNALKVLQEEGLIHLTEAFYKPSQVGILVDHKKLYEYQVAQSQFDPLIKCILRLYGGDLYQRMVRINETEIAGILGQTTEQVRHYLSFLDESQIIDYEAQKDIPQLTFLVAKQPLDQLPIDEERINLRRQLKLKKAERMIKYLHDNSSCRTAQLLNYFGEIDYEQCGVCDNCIDQKRHRNDHHYQEHYKKQILNLVSEGLLLDTEAFVHTLDPSHKELFMDVLTRLLDHGLLYYDEFGKIRSGRHNNL